MPKNSEVYLDEALKRWITKTAWKEHWRVASWFEIGDLIQEGYLCYLKCRNKYTLGPPEPGHQALDTTTPDDKQRRHFMALVQRAYFNRIMTLANQYTQGREEPIQAREGETENTVLEQMLPPQSEVASVVSALVHAPVELQEALSKVASDVRVGLEGAEFARSKLYWEGNRLRRGRRVRRETTSEFWLRVVGDGQFPQKLTAYLRS